MNNLQIWFWHISTTETYFHKGYLPSANSLTFRTIDSFGKIRSSENERYYEILVWGGKRRAKITSKQMIFAIFYPFKPCRVTDCCTIIFNLAILLHNHNYIVKRKKVIYFLSGKLKYKKVASKVFSLLRHTFVLSCYSDNYGLCYFEIVELRWTVSWIFILQIFL